MVQKTMTGLLAYVALVLILLAGTGCQTQKTEQRFADEYPIIIVSTSGAGKTTVHFTCLNKATCPASLEVGEFGVPNNPGMDEKANLYLPSYNHSDIYYIDSGQQSVRKIKTGPELDGFLGIHPVYAHGKMILAGRNVVIFLDKDLAPKTIRLNIANDSAGGEIGELVPGEADQIIAYNTSPVRKEGQDFAQVFVIDLESANVKELLLPAPSSSESSAETLANVKPGERYSLKFVGVTQDLDRLYYTFLDSEKAGEDLRTRLGLFDTKTRKELHIYDSTGSCLPADGYRQRGDYLFVKSGQGGPLVLKLEDFSPLVNFAELRTDFPVRFVSPLGPYFLAGTANKVLVFSSTGERLKEYDLPPELFGSKYMFVEYLGN